MNAKDEMLKTIGVSSVDELFSDIPAEVRRDRIDMPAGMDEMEAGRKVAELAKMNRLPKLSFAGAGLYQHYIPAAVREVVMRSEFITAYTPYQPEISQGVLQAIFEYQSLISELTGFDIVNSSMYDMGSALGEAAIMAYRIKEGRTFLVPRHMHRWKRRVLEAYAHGLGLKVEGVEMDPGTGLIDVASLRSQAAGDACGVYVESPNVFGCVEKGLGEIREAAKDVPLIVGVDPILLSLVKPPADYGADIVIAEGGNISFGMNFGGPLLGIFATTKEHLRKMPGRIVGATLDADGRRAYCLTIQAREQHIRRAKATSNICTNEALCAVGSAAYISLLGRDGLKKVAMKCYENAHNLAKGIGSIKGFKAPVFGADFYCEFAARTPQKADDLLRELSGSSILGGVKLSDHTTGFDENHMLVASTEVHASQDIETYLTALKGCSGGGT
jgi:glycine dehydrogenase subunit 1